MLVHGGFIGLVDEDMVLVSYILDLGLHHPIMVVEPIVGVLGLADSQHQLLLYLFLSSSLSTFEVIFSLSACSLRSSYSSSGYSSSSSPCALESS